MDEQDRKHASKVIAGQEWYEDLLHVFAAHHYTRSVLIDSKNALDGLYKIERWEAAGKPTMMVTVGDNGLIELWGSPELWGQGRPRDGGTVAGFLDDLLAARRPG
jgi:hypothetical protein